MQNNIKVRTDGLKRIANIQNGWTEICVHIDEKGELVTSKSILSCCQYFEKITKNFSLKAAATVEFFAYFDVVNNVPKRS